MKRVVVTALAASAIAVLVFACDDGFDSSYGDGYARTPNCERHASCGTCTPVLGCGWCFTNDGQGNCTSSPDRCAGSNFGWTWETSGCRIEAEASVSVPDAGVAIDSGDSGVPPEGSPTDSAPPPQNGDDAGEDDSGDTSDTSPDDAAPSSGN